MNWSNYLLSLPLSLAFFGSQRIRRVTSQHPLVIQSPRIGFLNFMGNDARENLEQDRAALTPLFQSAEEKSGESAPRCDVLMIYGKIEESGLIAGSTNSLRQIIANSGAAIVIVASENTAQRYIAAGKRPGQGRANIVMTIDRKGAIFSRFCVSLLTKMFEGKSMLLAWVDLAPQAPEAKGHENCPDTIFAAEISHIVFK
jgi:hypothetical protein